MSAYLIFMLFLAGLLYVVVGYSFALDSEWVVLSRSRTKIFLKKTLVIAFWPWLVLSETNFKLEKYIEYKYGARVPLVSLILSSLFLTELFIRGDMVINLHSFLVGKLFVGGFWIFLAYFVLIAIVTIIVFAIFVDSIEALLTGNNL